MKNGLIFIAALSGLFFFSCEKSTAPFVEISGITYTNEAGEITGDVDPADWIGKWLERKIQFERKFFWIYQTLMRHN